MSVTTSVCMNSGCNNPVRPGGTICAWCWDKYQAELRAMFDPAPMPDAHETKMIPHPLDCPCPSCVTRPGPVVRAPGGQPITGDGADDECCRFHYTGGPDREPCSSTAAPAPCARAVDQDGRCRDDDCPEHGGPEPLPVRELCACCEALPRYPMPEAMLCRPCMLKGCTLEPRQRKCP